MKTPILRASVVGLGKMGISHLSILRANPHVVVPAVCDANPFMLELCGKYLGVQSYSDCEKMLDREALDALVIATPSASHGPLVRTALERGVHVFCEKPFSLDPTEGESLAKLAASRQLVNQVGYHYRFVASFQEAKRLVEQGHLGRIHHVRAEAYGPVVLRPEGNTWRSQKQQGGGCLYDYASHAINLVEFMAGPISEVHGTYMGSVFSKSTEDEVYSTLTMASGASGQLAVNWSDESHRKMSMRISVWGTNGRVNVDRQEIQVFLRHGVASYDAGWTTRYTTDLTVPVGFYLRGEEYSAQIESFVTSVMSGKPSVHSDFETAVATDRTIEMIAADAERASRGASADVKKKRRSFSFGG